MGLGDGKSRIGGWGRVDTWVDTCVGGVDRDSGPIRSVAGDGECVMRMRVMIAC